MLRPQFVRGRVLLITLIGGLLVSGGLYASFAPDLSPRLDLRFGASDGFSVQGPQEMGAQVLDVVFELRDGYVASLQAFEEYQTLDGYFQTPLGAVVSHIDAGAPRSTTVSVGDTTVTFDEYLEPVPEADYDAVLLELYQAGWTLVGPALETPMPGDGDDGEPGDGDGGDDGGWVAPDISLLSDDGSLFHITDEDRTLGVLWLNHDPPAAELIVLETPQFGGLHVVAGGWFIEHRDSDGHILDLWVRNPFQTVAYGPLDTGVTLTDVHCSAGECIGEQQVGGLCAELGPPCSGSGTVSLGYGQGGGHVDGLPGTLLHAWSNDALLGGAGLSVLESHDVALSGSFWGGNPFGEGMWIADEDGLVASLRVGMPSAENPRLQVELAGPVVNALHGESVLADVDLSEFEFHVQWGGMDVSSAGLYATLDPLHATLVGTWTDAEAAVRALTVSSLLDPQTLLSMVDDGMGDVSVAVGPVSATISQGNVRIEGVPDAPTGLVGLVTGPASVAVARLVDIGTDATAAEVRLIQSTLGCDDERGCLAIVYDGTESLGGALAPVGDASPVPVVVPSLPEVPESGGAPEVPGSPGANDPSVPDLDLGGLSVPDVQVMAMWLHGEARTALLIVPDLVSCAAASSATVDACIAGTPDVVAAAAGLLADGGGFVGIVPDLDDDVLRITESDGNELIQIRNGRIQAAGLGATWGNNNLVRVITPDGEDLCIRHTFDPSDATQWPSLSAACSGLGGNTYTIQPGAVYETTPAGGLQALRVVDPTDGGSDAFYYYNDGETTTLYTALAPQETVRIPSTLVRVVGNPLTSPNFQIQLAGDSVDDYGVYSQLDVARAAYGFASAGQSVAPVANQLALVFRLVDAPQSSIRVDDGRGAFGDVSGSAWQSGQRDHTITVVTAQDDVAERVDLVYDVGRNPAYGSSPHVELSLVGLDAKSAQRSYSGTIPAEALSGYSEGALLQFALAWTQNAGPAAFTRWDDNAGSFYGYKLDTVAPTASMTLPSSSDNAVFTATWNSAGDAGSGLDTFRVDTQIGETVAADAWSTWIDGRSAGAPRYADFTGTPDARHWFRAQACDRAGNCGAWTAADSVAVLPSADADLTAPSILVSAPAANAVLSDVALLAWSVTDEGGPSTVNVHQRAAASQTWKPVYSGDDAEAAWDTNALLDGPYLLRFVATDGRQSDSEEVPVTLVNGNVAPSLDDARQALAGSPKVSGDPRIAPPGAQPSDGKDSPSAPLGVLLAGIVAALAISWRRRRRS